MSLVNALLVRWAGGWHTVEDSASIATWGRYEGFLSLGAAQSTAEVERITTAVFARRAQPVITTKIGIEPTGDGDVPFDDWNVSGEVTAPAEGGTDEALLVASLTLAEDADGVLAFLPELNTAGELYEQTLERWLARMANGTLGGASASASPATPTAPEPSSTFDSGGGGVRSATVIVAPSNASDQSKAGADVVLTGSGDESGLDDAAALLPAHGGLILITEGDVYLSNQWDAPVSKAVSVAGYGGSATRIKVVDAATWTDDHMIGIGTGIATEYGLTLRDLAIVPEDVDGTLVDSSTGITTAVRITGSDVQTQVLNVNFLPSNVAGLMGTGGIGRVRVEGCMFFLVGIQYFDALAFDTDTLGPGDIVITGNLIMGGADNGNSEVRISGSAPTSSGRAGGVTITGNTMFEVRVRLTNCKEVSVQGNAILRGDDSDAIYVQGSTQVAVDNAMNQGNVNVENSEDVSVCGAGGWGFLIDSSKGVRVSGSWVGNCYVFDSSFVSVSGASIYLRQYLFDHLLTISGSDDCAVTGCTLVAEVATGHAGDDNTYDGIWIDSDSDRNNIQANTVRGKVDAKQLRYGIRVNSSDCDDNLVTNNDLKNAGATANFSDAGTGTVTTAGNRT